MKDELIQVSALSAVICLTCLDYTCVVVIETKKWQSAVLTL